MYGAFGVLKYNSTAVAAPVKLSITGIIFVNGDKNSPFICDTCSGCTNTAFPNPVVPIPIITSLKQYPTNILPNPNIIKGTIIASGASWAKLVFTLDPLGLMIKVLINRRIE